MSASVILAILGALGIFFLNNKNKDLKAKLQSADASKDDAVLSTQQNQVQEEIATQVAALAAKKNKQLSDEELAKELK